MYAKIKKEVFNLLDPVEGGTVWDKVINSFIVTLILLNVLAVIFETVGSIYTAHAGLFRTFELFSVIVFSIEYLLRIWVCTEKEAYKHPLFGRLRYIFSFESLIDLLAIVPFYLPLVVRYDLRFIRILRLIRFLRFFKLGRYLNATRLIHKVFQMKKAELILCFVVNVSLIVVASSLLYFAEHDVQPDKFPSIPESMWMTIVTLTTVGFGDVYPITFVGKFLTGCIALLGVVMFALPAGILASGFSEIFHRMKIEGDCCPHCGKPIEEEKE